MKRTIAIYIPPALYSSQNGIRSPPLPLHFENYMPHTTTNRPNSQLLKLAEIVALTSSSEHFIKYGQVMRHLFPTRTGRTD